MVERVDQGKCCGAIECSPVIQRRGDADRRLVDVRDAEVDLPHLEEPRSSAREGFRWRMDRRKGAVHGFEVDWTTAVCKRYG